MELEVWKKCSEKWDKSFLPFKHYNSFCSFDFKLIRSLYQLLQNWNKLQWFPCVAQVVKNLPAMQETQIQSLDQEDPLEKGMATQSSILAWRIPWTEKPGGLQSMESHRVRHD